MSCCLPIYRRGHSHPEEGFPPKATERWAGLEPALTPCQHPKWAEPSLEKTPLKDKAGDRLVCWRPVEMCRWRPPDGGALA